MANVILNLDIVDVVKYARLENDLRNYDFTRISYHHIN